MVSLEEATKTVESRLAKNLTILGSWETDEDWVFGLGFVDEEGEVKPIVGDSTARINKETGEMT